ncbi:hypothetical protein ACS0TY_000331 [Phlomoides rotata]
MEVKLHSLSIILKCQMGASPTSVYPTPLVVIVGGEDDGINHCFPNSSIVIMEDEEDNIRVCIHNIIIVIVGHGGIAVGAFLPFTSFEFLLLEVGEIYVKVVVSSKVPLPSYWPGLDDKRPQREVVFHFSLSSHYLINARYGQGGRSVAACLFLSDCLGKMSWFVRKGANKAAAAASLKVVVLRVELEGDGVASGGLRELIPWCTAVAVGVDVTLWREMADEVTLSGKAAHRKFPLKAAKLIERSQHVGLVNVEKKKEQKNIESDDHMGKDESFSRDLSYLEMHQKFLLDDK